jgi:hypothetical protein
LHMPRLHGLTPIAGDGKREFHFGVRSLFGSLRIAQAFPGRNKYPTLKPWSRVQADKFLTAFGKLEDTFWKINRTAELYDVARRRIVNIKGPTISSEELGATQQALQDIPLHLDCALLSLRILVDCLANLTSQFYLSESVPFRSFREQIKWFTQKRTDVDPEYAQILKQYSNWFTTLAGDSKREGLRDLVVHGMVRTQLIFQPGATQMDNRVHSFLYGFIRSQAESTQALEPLLQRMMAEFMEYLDHYTMHFSARIDREIGCKLVDWNDPRSSLWFQIEGEFDSQWIFPPVVRD